MTDKTLRYIGFRGIAEGVQDGLHARTVRNMYLDSGVVRKRHGYQQLVQFDGPVNGIFQVVVAGAAYVLVYAGTRFYLRDATAPDDMSNYRDITLSGTVNRVQPDRLVSRRIAVYQHDDRAYIVGCGDYLVLKAVGDDVQLRRVEDEGDTHVPTTSVGIGCMNDTRYIPTTVDEQTVGLFFVEENGDYRAVTLDGDESTPQEGVVYYRRFDKAQLGRHMEDVNLLCSYRVNTLYGTDAAGATFQLDAECIDPDSDTTIALDVVEDGEVVHYELYENDPTAIRRAPVVGDDLGGVTLDLGVLSQAGVGSIHFGVSHYGDFVLRATGGSLRWYCTGTSSAAWNTASLVLHSPTCDRVVATAIRSSFLARYTITWLEEHIAFPADMGEIVEMDDVFLHTQPEGTLPILVSTLLSFGQTWGTLDYRSATITFSRPTTPAGLADNITVRFKHRDRVLNADVLCRAVSSTLYGVAGNADRLFMGGAESAPTTDYHSESADWTYFSPSGATELGKQGAIEGYTQVGHSLVTLLKGHDIANAYWRQGTWVTSNITLGDETFELRSALFALTRTSVLPSVASGWGSASMGGNVLYLGEEGLFKLNPNAVADDCKAQRLSAPIRDQRWQSNAVAVVHDRRYLVSDGQAVYVADSRFRLQMDGDSNYEWTVWDIPHVNVWYRQDGKLYFGTTDGALCMFGEEWQDVTFTDTTAGQLAVHAADNTLSVHQDLPLQAGDEFYFNHTLYAYLCPIVDKSEAEIYVDNTSILNVHEDTPVHILVGDVVGETVYIDNVDWGKCTFRLRNSAGNAVAIPTGLNALLVDLAGTKVLCDAPADGAVHLVHPDGHVLTLYAGQLPATLTARIVRRKGVHAVYEWEPNALNTPDLAKLLLSVTVEAAAYCRGEATIAVRNSLDQRQSAVLGLSVLDYRWLDMGKFSFDGDMRRSATVRLKMRFQALSWRIESDNAGDLVLSGICLRYRYLRNAKEVLD